MVHGKQNGIKCGERITHIYGASPCHMYSGIETHGRRNITFEGGRDVTIFVLGRALPDPDIHCVKANPCVTAAQ